MSNVFSTQEQLDAIARILTGYLKLPFSQDSIPGALMESVISEVRGSEILETYDFVDILNKNKKVGWQVKSTKASTPVTWKRAKIPNAINLIASSQSGGQELQDLGDAIIKFCNDHASQSIHHYGLDEIGYSRLIVHKSGKLTYFEKLLCTKNSPKIFIENEFEWRWSTPKKTTKKEQLPALHGIHKASQKKWFAWHGLGENQLHFSGEKEWWPSNNAHKIDFSFPSKRLSPSQFMEFLNKISALS